MPYNPYNFLKDKKKKTKTSVKICCQLSKGRKGYFRDSIFKKSPGAGCPRTPLENLHLQRLSCARLNNFTLLQQWLYLNLLKKYVFCCSVLIFVQPDMSTGQRKKSESPTGIDLMHNDVKQGFCGSNVHCGTGLLSCTNPIWQKSRKFK